MRYSFFLPRQGTSAEGTRTRDGEERTKERERDVYEQERMRKGEKEGASKEADGERRQKRRGLDRARRASCGRDREGTDGENRR